MGKCDKIPVMTGFCHNIKLNFLIVACIHSLILWTSNLYRSKFIVTVNHSHDIEAWTMPLELLIRYILDCIIQQLLEQWILIKFLSLLFICWFCLLMIHGQQVCFKLYWKYYRLQYNNSFIYFLKKHKLNIVVWKT